MAPFQERFEVLVAPREVKLHANRLFGSCNDDDPDEEQLLDNAELIEGTSSSIRALRRFDL